MYSKNTLSHSDVVSAVALFEQGYTATSVAMSLDLARFPVQMLYQRWQLRGAGALAAIDNEGHHYSQYIYVHGETSDIEPPTILVNGTIAGTTPCPNPNHRNQKHPNPARPEASARWAGDKGALPDPE